ncbi:carboxypeptidase regulatory-like domain-containing protein [Agromyces sp. NPDC058110]|uniref:carboxypeptidase regulatory-like domain-containing protein n=1 Tax=Agromyces sp. NPDC058110 TaxID=3346345 RepID=UPI0036D8CE6A
MPRPVPTQAAVRAAFAVVLTILLLAAGVAPATAGRLPDPTATEGPGEPAPKADSPSAVVPSGAGTFTGTVTGFEGVPLANVYVTLDYLGENHNDYSVETVSVITDAAGRYRAEGLLPGPYDLSFGYVGALSEYKYAEWKAIGWGQGSGDPGSLRLGRDEVREANARLIATGVITGRAVAADGGAAGGVSVYLIGSGSGSAFVRYNADGTYRIERVLPGTYKVKFVPSYAGPYQEQWWPNRHDASLAEEVTVAENGVVTGVDARVERAGSIAGVVTSNGRPLAGVNVVAERQVEGSDSTWAKTDANGRYKIVGLESDEYKLHFFGRADEACKLDRWWPNASAPVDAEMIALPLASDLVGFDAELPASSVIAGVVTAPGSNSIQVSLHRGGSWRTILADASGAYRFCTTPGSYTLGFNAGQPYRAEWWNDRDSLFEAEWFDVAEGETVDGLVTEMTAGATVSGTVAVADGSAPPITTVTAYGTAENGESWDGTTTSSVGGSYAFVGLRPGRYTLKFSVDVRPSRWLDQWWGGVRTKAAAVRFDVGRDAVVDGMDALLDEGASITGSVTDSSGRPIQGASVGVSLPADDTQRSPGAKTDAEGRYEIVGVPSGTYPIDISHSAFFSSRLGPVAVVQGAVSSGHQSSLVRRSSIQGRITHEAGWKITKGVTAYLYRESGGTWKSEDAASLGSDGKFSFDWCRAGRYKLQFRPSDGYGYTGEWWRDQRDLASAEIIELTEGAVFTADAVLSGGRVGFSGVQIVGAPAVGSELRAKASSSTSGVVLRYQWLENGSEIPGAVDPVYTPSADQLGSWLNVQVTASAPGYVEVSSTQYNAVLVKLGTLDFAEPTVSGVPRVGSKLFVVATSRTEKAEFDYVWSADSVPIPGAVRSSFTPTAAQIDKQISVRVTATAAGYAARAKQVEGIGGVLPGSLAISGPAISGPAFTGRPTIGRAMSVTVSSAPSAKFAFQWLANGVPVRGATAKSFVPTVAHAGKRISVQVTASAAGYTTTKRTSSLTLPMPGVPPKAPSAWR